jgi:hypothetical protein
MAFELPNGQVLLGTLTASSDYNDAADQYCVVTSTSGTAFRKTNTLGEMALGILQDRPSSGAPGTICIFGVTKARVIATSHAAWAVRTKMTGSTTGGLTSSTTVTRYTLGRLLERVSSNSTGLYTLFVNHEGGGSSGALTGA